MFVYIYIYIYILYIYIYIYIYNYLYYNKKISLVKSLLNYHKLFPMASYHIPVVFAKGCNRLIKLSKTSFFSAKTNQTCFLSTVWTCLAQNKPLDSTV